MNDLKAFITSRIFLTIIIIIVVGAYPTYRIWHSYSEIENIAEIDLPLIEILTNIEIHQLEQSINLERTIRYSQATTSNMSSAEISKSTNASEVSIRKFKALSTKVGEELIKARNTILKALKIANHPDQEVELNYLLTSLEGLVEKREKYEQNVFELLSQLKSKTFDAEIYNLAEEVEAQEDEFNTQIEQILLHLEKFTENQLKRIEGQERVSLRSVETITIIGITIAFILLFIYHRSVVGQIDQLMTYVFQLSEHQVIEDGKSTKDINRAKEIKAAVEKLAFKSYKTKQEKQELVKVVDLHSAKAYETVFDMKKNLDKLSKSPLSRNSDIRKLLREYDSHLSELKKELDLISIDPDQKETDDALI